MAVTTCIDLYIYINQLVVEKSGNARALEEYLRALLKQVQPTKGVQPSYQDIATFLTNSYEGELAEYSDDWASLQVTLNTPNTPPYYEEMDSYEHFERLLKSFIADLHHFNTNIRHGVAPKYENDGIKAPSGRIWQRTDVRSFLETGVYLLGTGDYDQEPEYDDGGWHVLDFILNDGAQSE